MVRASSLAVGVLCGPVVCLYVGFAACFCPGRLRRHTDTEEKKRFERRQKVAPRPLVVRQRQLTIPLPDTGAGRKTLDQSQSRLLRLPLELRQMIYRFVLGDSTMHIILKEHKLGHIRCREEDCSLGYSGRTLSRECCWGAVDGANIWSPVKGARESTDGDIIPFLSTCRQIYSESIDYLYSTNTFSFSDLDCLRYFSATTLPRRFERIRRLDIEWCMTWPIYDPVAQQLLLNNPVLYPPYDEATWEETWRIVAHMPNLRSLRVSLLHFEGFGDAACESRILAPLRNVTHVPVFEVRVSWSGADITDAPFQLIRPFPPTVEGEGDSW